MASKFTEFLLALGEDPRMVENLKKDPEAILAKSDLTPQEGQNG
jgi:hypothetical protein